MPDRFNPKKNSFLKLSVWLKENWVIILGEKEDCRVIFVDYNHLNVFQVTVLIYKTLLLFGFMFFTPVIKFLLDHWMIM